MRYQGGKARLAPELAPYIQDALFRYGGTLVEPFVGGFNIVPALGSLCERAYCSDVHRGPITLYRAFLAGWRPGPVDLELYRELRARRNWSDPLTAFAAFGCSYGGREWGGYARTRARRRDEGREGEPRDYADEALRGLSAKLPHMRKVTFLHCDYRALRFTRPAVIYCDPPYAGTTGYTGTGAWDAPAFWAWCEARAADGHEVLVSEFAAPQYWEVLWEKMRPVTLRRTNYDHALERLYLVRQRPGHSTRPIPQ